MTRPARIHPTALVDPEAKLAEDVRVGPFAIIEAGVRLGPGCVVGANVHILGNVEVGSGNHFHTGCVIGDYPQHLGYKGEPTGVVIGDENIFREYVTVHRGMPAPAQVMTRIGHRNLFMAGSHVAHDCTIGDKCILANNALVGGHAEVHDGAYLSGNTCVHQNCRVGRLAMISGTTSISQDLPPYFIVQETNVARGINVVGMRRAGIPAEDILAVTRAYRIINKQNLPLRAALDKLEAEEGMNSIVRDLIAFIRSAKRGVVLAIQGPAGD